MSAIYLALVLLPVLLSLRAAAAPVEATHPPRVTQETTGCATLHQRTRPGSADSEGSGWEVRTVDVESGEIVSVFLGKLLAPTSDYRGALISLGDSVQVVPLSER